MRRGAAGAALVLAVGLLTAGAVPSARAEPPERATAALPMCGSAGTPTTQLRHVLLVVLENHSYDQVVGNTATAPYETSLAATCGVATEMFGVTHPSASNYLALTAGTYPSGSLRGCSSVARCAASGTSIFDQLRTAGLSWTSYEESMPKACAPASSGAYKIGHNPAIFYGLPDCAAHDLAVADLTAASGRLYADLTAQTLPSFGFVTPNRENDGEGRTGLAGADTWLKAFLARVTATAGYRSGSTAILVTYDEGDAPDSTVGESCTDRTADLAGRRESCHVPFFVVYPWSHGADATFLTHYSVTRAVEDLFGLSRLGGAASAPSLLGHLGLPLTTS